MILKERGSVNTEMKPLYMWAGGKSKMLKHYQPILDGIINNTPKKTFVEPFFGGGAVYAHMRNKGAFEHYVINDINVEVMGLFEAIRDTPEKFMANVDEGISKYLKIEGKDARKKHYYDLRKQYWSSPDASTLFLLMRLGFNGIWQTCKESKGLFGTPAGLLNHVRPDQIYSKDNLYEWHTALHASNIFSNDYSEINFDSEDAVLFLDPPYRDSFTTYGTVFGDDEQHRLVNWMKDRHAEGATVLFSNRVVDGDPFFENLLPEADFHYFEVTYTAGRRKKTDSGYEAKPAREFLAVLKSDDEGYKRLF